MPSRRYSRLVGGERVQLRREVGARYRGGESIRELAVSLGRSYGFVRRLLVEAEDVTLRGRGGAHRRKRR